MNIANSKENYKKIIEQIAKDILLRADDILVDFDKCLKRVEINTVIEPNEVVITRVIKDYYTNDGQNSEHLLVLRDDKNNG